MMRKLTALAAVMCVIIGGFIGLSAQEYEITIPSTSINRGERAVVPVELRGGSGTASMAITLRYDAFLLAVRSVRAGGTFLMECSEPETFDDFTDLGQALLSIACNNVRLGEGVLFEIELEALAGAEPSSELTPINLSVGGNPATLRAQPATITIVGTPPVQEAPQDVLFQNAPNPFRARTTFRYSLAAASTVELYIYTSGGKLVKAFPPVTQGRGTYSFEYSPTFNERQGLYFLQMRTERGVYNVPFIIGAE